MLEHLRIIPAVSFPVLALVCGLSGPAAAQEGAIPQQPTEDTATTPTPENRPALIEKLVSDLGSPDFATRENATRQLERMGQEPVHSLEKATNSTDVEVRNRAQYILDRIRRGQAEADARADRGGRGRGEDVDHGRLSREIADLRDDVSKLRREIEQLRQELAAGRQLFPPRGTGGFSSSEDGALGLNAKYSGEGLGVRVRNIDPALRSQLKLEGGAGVVVDQVLENSPARDGGLQPNDIVMRFNGRPIVGDDGVADLIEAVQTAPKGQPVKLEVLRGGERRNLEVTLPDRGPKLPPPAGRQKA